jgi:hypothetical protein
VVEIDNKLKEDIVKNLATNKHLRKVYNHLVKRLKGPLIETNNGIKIILLNYYINRQIKLIYLRNSEHIYERLYIPRKYLLAIIE